MVVGAGEEPPPAWSDAPGVVVDEAALQGPAATVALHDAWARRRPVVVRLAVDPTRFRAPRSVAVEPWTLSAGFEILEDRLQFLVWANNYDCRSGEPVWWWARKAQRLGAGPPAGGAGDVTLADGRAAWIDGGPRQPFGAAALGGAVVVHRETVERGRLDAARAPVDPRAELAPDQLAAVAHRVGPARIIAPAGSGKTRVLTERLRHLVVDRAWERDVILAVAYNKRAQQELDARTADFRPRTRTLNSLGYAIVGDARGRLPAVAGERDARRLVERLAPIRRRRANTDPIEPYLEALGWVRLGLLDPEEVEGDRDDVPGLAELFPRYRAELRAAGAVDFDEQVYGAVEALLADGELRARWQTGCRHLLVDEFQDLTPAHVVLLRLLASPGLDVFGVGDDDQVIYGHAGADPAFLIGYERLFPAAGDHPLRVNYRCPPAVVAAATRLLGYNRRRVAKDIRPGRGVDAARTDALVVRTESTRGAVDALVEGVHGRLQSGVSPVDVAVLARVNSLLLAPQVALHAAGVPVVPALDAGVLDRTGLRAALAYLRIATAADGAIAGADVVEILRRPSRGLPPWFSDRLRRRRAWTVQTLLGIAASVGAKDSAKVEHLVDDLISLRAVVSARGATTAAVLRAVRDEIGLGKAMGLLDSSGGEGSSHLDDLEALEQVAALHPEAATFETWLRATLAPGGQGVTGVTLATVHRVKGMEWDHVLVWGANAGILPHRLADDEEEERRVFHVAITRGREEVVVLADRSRPSPFLAELAGDAPRRPPAPKARAGAVADRGGLAPEDRSLEEALRAWRAERARADRVPAYVVASDRTLRAIVTNRPSDLAALRQVPGIGPTKLDLYGEEILAVLAPA